MGSITTEELRIRRLEESFGKLKNSLDNFSHKLGQVAQDSSQGMQSSSQGGGGIRHYFAQAEGGIGPAVGNALGTGNARLLKVVDGARYQQKPEKTVPVVNSTTGGIAHLTYLELILSGGRYSVIVGNCTPAPEAAPVHEDDVEPPPEEGLKRAIL